ncbi:MAG: hypothetical protein KZQ83_08580 [gamma proteobacterium symbiont of Taylorina sp.]|nr:hypothetical protein [gamma proteobacterium symbiont of Taylorina sp.]
MNQLDKIVDVLNGINSNLTTIANALNNDSFLDSKWFAALIGAGSAIIIFIIEKYFSWRKRENKKLLEFCKWLNEQWTFRSPDTLLGAAHSTIYGHEERTSNTEEVKVIPEKPLGEKMIIELRRDLKWWREPDRTLHRYFKKYEKLLSKFDQLQEADPALEKILIEQAMVYYDKIDIYAYKVTGDNEHTAI